MGQRAVRVLHVVPSFTVGGAGRTLVSVANRTKAFGLYEHVVMPLEPRFCDPAAVAQASRAGVQTLLCQSDSERMKEVADADIVQVEWWQHPSMEHFLTEALPACRLVLWSHMVGTVAPHVLRPELQLRCDAVVASASVSLHDPLFQDPSCELMLGRAAGVQVASAPLRSFIPGCYDSDRIRNVPTSTSHTSIRNQFSIGYLGTVSFVKMHPYYVRMHANLAISDYRVIVCGGDRQLLLKRQAEGFGQAQRFDFRGFVENIDQFFQELDVFGYPLTPDTSAASELVLQEAMWASVPPVVFPYGGLRNVVQHDWNGLVVHSELEYREALEFLSFHPDERKRLGQNAHYFADSMFRLERCAEKFHGIYQQLFARSKQPRPPEFRSEAFRSDVFRSDVSRSDVSASDRFLAMLSDRADEYNLSARAVELADLLNSEAKIAQASVLMRDGGVIPFANEAPNDLTLKRWAVLTQMYSGQALEALRGLIELIEQDIGERSWRYYYYLGLVAVELEDWNLARVGFERVIDEQPSFRPAFSALKALQFGAVRLSRNFSEPSVQRLIRVCCANPELVEVLEAQFLSHAESNSRGLSRQPHEIAASANPGLDSDLSNAASIDPAPVLVEIGPRMTYGMFHAPTVVVLHADTLASRRMQKLRRFPECGACFDADAWAWPLLDEEGGVLGLSGHLESRLCDYLVSSTLNRGAPFAVVPASGVVSASGGSVSPRPSTDAAMADLYKVQDIVASSIREFQPKLFLTNASPNPKLTAAQENFRAALRGSAALEGFILDSIEMLRERFAMVEVEEFRNSLERLFDQACDEPLLLRLAWYGSCKGVSGCREYLEEQQRVAGIFRSLLASVYLADVAGVISERWLIEAIQSRFPECAEFRFAVRHLQVSLGLRWPTIEHSSQLRHSLHKAEVESCRLW